MSVAGVDGARGGWLAATLDDTRQTAEWAIHRHFRDVLEATAACHVVIVDIPIGLTGGPRRECDVLARRLLGYPRANSVFDAPPRPTLGLGSHADASRLSRELCGRGMSRQAYSIAAKVAEVDTLLRADPALQRRLREGHPEVVFHCLGGASARHAKHTREGYAERRALLNEALPWLEIPESPPPAFPTPGATADDALDSLALAWAALRVRAGAAATLPADPPGDACGLRMEIILPQR